MFCFFLDRATNSVSSYVRNLAMNQKLLDGLPIDLGPQVGCEKAEEAQRLIKDRKTWIHFYPNTQIKVFTKAMMLLEFDNWEIANANYVLWRLQS